MIRIPFLHLLSPWTLGSVEQMGGMGLDWVIHTFDVKPWQNNVSPHSRDICILMGSALTQNLKGKPWVVLNMPLVEGLHSCGDVIEGDSSPMWVLDESVIFKQGFFTEIPGGR